MERSGSVLHCTAQWPSATRRPFVASCSVGGAFCRAVQPCQARISASSERYAAVPAWLQKVWQREDINSREADQGHSGARARTGKGSASTVVAIDHLHGSLLHHLAQLAARRRGALCLEEAALQSVVMVLSARFLCCTLLTQVDTMVLHCGRGHMRTLDALRDPPLHLDHYKFAGPVPVE